MTDLEKQRYMTKIYQVHNKVFSLIFAKKEDAETFVKDNSATTSNLLQITEVNVAGSCAEIMQQEIERLRSELVAARDVLDQIKGGYSVLGESYGGHTEILKKEYPETVLAREAIQRIDAALNKNTEKWDGNGN
jgi:uncharacterized small protein (DUF1192 family)